MRGGDSATSRGPPQSCRTPSGAAAALAAAALCVYDCQSAISLHHRDAPAGESPRNTRLANPQSAPCAIPCEHPLARASRSRCRMCRSGLSTWRPSAQDAPPSSLPPINDGVDPTVHEEKLGREAHRARLQQVSEQHEQEVAELGQQMASWADTLPPEDASPMPVDTAGSVVERAVAARVEMAAVSVNRAAGCVVVFPPLSFDACTSPFAPGTGCEATAARGAAVPHEDERRERGTRPQGRAGPAVADASARCQTVSVGRRSLAMCIQSAAVRVQIVMTIKGHWRLTSWRWMQLRHLAHNALSVPCCG